MPLTPAEMAQRQSGKYSDKFPELCIEGCGCAMTKEEYQTQITSANNDSVTCPICGMRWQDIRREAF